MKEATARDMIQAHFDALSVSTVMSPLASLPTPNTATSRSRAS
jgi:hypothetical protein